MCTLSLRFTAVIRFAFWLRARRNKNFANKNARHPRHLHKKSVIHFPSTCLADQVVSLNFEHPGIMMYLDIIIFPSHFVLIHNLNS